MTPIADIDALVTHLMGDRWHALVDGRPTRIDDAIDAASGALAIGEQTTLALANGDSTRELRLSRVVSIAASRGVIRAELGPATPAPVPAVITNLRQRVAELAREGWVPEPTSDDEQQPGIRDAVSNLIGALSFGESGVVKLRRGRAGFATLHLHCLPADVNRYGQITWRLELH